MPDRSSLRRDTRDTLAQQLSELVALIEEALWAAGRLDDLVSDDDVSDDDYALVDEASEGLLPALRQLRSSRDKVAALRTLAAFADRSNP
jgi:hypothetical protein